MKAAKQSDEWLMGQVAAGRREHLELLVRRHATPLLTYLSRMTGDRHLGEELVQEVFLTVWTKRRTYKLSKPFRTWLYAIATNRCRLAFRRTKGKKMSSLEDKAEATPAVDHPPPDQAALDGERDTLVADAVARLPEQQRMVVTLRVWGDMSYAEIALAAGRNEATVRSHMHRALASLRTYLAPALARD